MKKFALLCASSALVLPSMAFAQSTGTAEIEEEAIIVEGRSQNGVEGIVVPDSTKPRGVLTQDAIDNQRPGQTILDTINLLPGVSFQNNDPYGSAGGTLTIRGFDSSRISLTFDGVQLNDSGNYAIYSNQMIDPELIERVNVNFGTTDVDSPTASAVGGTVNIRTRIPSRNLGGLVSASYGDWDFHRLFGMIETGDITGFGTRAWVSGSYATNRWPYNNFGEINKQQYNARIYQDIGANGDFVSISGHYNENRNNFGGSVALRNDRDVPGGFPQTREDRFYEIEPCMVSDARPGVADFQNECGTTFDERWNPSNTGNVRVNSRLSLTDNLILTVDPTYQYVKANGGGTVDAFERANRHGLVGYGFGSESYRDATGSNDSSIIFTGVDLNGDGDLLDVVNVLAPSQTQTHRFTVVGNLIWDLNDSNRFRVSYTWDRARHRQTGQVGYLDQWGRATDVFPVNDPLIDANGEVIQKRDRLSYAILHQVAAQYVGQFMDDRLTVDIGARVPFFRRNLDQNCYTTSAGGFVTCTAEPQAEVLAAFPSYVPPREVTYDYSAFLPNAGLIYDLTDTVSVFGNASRNISVPSTDNLYNSLFLTGQDAQPDPEYTNTFEAGVRHTSNRIQAQLAGWFTQFSNRIAEAYDPELDVTIFRNLGEVTKWGIDANVAYRPIPELMFYVYGSYINSDIQDDILLGTANGVDVYAPTAGKREAGAPQYILGGRVQGTLGPLELGVQARYTGDRYVYDTNLPVFTGSPANPTQIFDAAVPAYTLVDFDARLSMAQWGLERTYVQFNVTNVFDEVYVGGFGGGLAGTRANGSFVNPPFVQMGAPRTVSASLVVGF